MLSTALKLHRSKTVKAMQREVMLLSTALKLHRSKTPSAEELESIQLSTALKLHRSKTSNYRFNFRFQPFRSRRSSLPIFFIIVSTHFQSLFALLKNKMKQLPTSVQVSFLIHLRLQNRRAVVPEPLQKSDTVHLNH